MFGPEDCWVSLKRRPLASLAVGYACGHEPSTCRSAHVQYKAPKPAIDVDYVTEPGLLLKACS